MNPEKDDIDPAWWEEAFSDPSREEYEAPEVLSMRLDRMSKEPGLGEFQRAVLEVLAAATSAMLKPDDWLNPFAPAFELGGRRSIVPSDLTPERVTLLARIAPLVEQPELRARVADIAWLYGDRSDMTMLDTAIDAYHAAPLTEDVWFSVGKDAWTRAFDLANRRGPDGRVVVEEMSQELKGYVLAATVADRFRVAGCAQLLRSHGLLESHDRVEVADSLERLAATAITVDARLSRHLEREAVAWRGKSDSEAMNAGMERVARTYIAEADARIAADPKSGVLVEGNFLEKAIATLRTLPRRYRLQRDLDSLIDQLRVRLAAGREMALESLMRIQSDPIDLTEAVSYARGRVSGHQSRFEALAAFATLMAPMDAKKTRESAERLVEGSLRHIFASETYSRDARKVAARPAAGDTSDDPAVWEEMVRTVALHAQIVAKGLIHPAQEVLTFEHRFDREYMTSLCVESPVIPEGHAALWGAGLTFGLGGDYGPAVAIVALQLEQVVRTLLKRNGVYTLHVDDRTGVESEKSLNALLDMEETRDLFGAGIVMELKALLVVQGAPNLRNDTAHGLLDDVAAWSYNAMYVWWFCLRLALWPVIQFRREASKSQDGDLAREGGTKVMTGNTEVAYGPPQSQSQ
jgi:hypothetical protein